MLLCFCVTAWTAEPTSVPPAEATPAVEAAPSTEAAPAAEAAPDDSSAVAPPTASTEEVSIETTAGTTVSLSLADAPNDKTAPEVVTAEVDWMAELMNGGNTAIALGLLFLAMVAFTVERLVRLRASSIAPSGLVDEVLPLWHRKAFYQIQQRCESQPSTLARMTGYLVEHRHADPELLIPGAGDIAVRELKQHNQKAFSLAVVAALAPLLGLLGTMIGMIESFKLVEQYGDEGGASMLAGSISKALITTAVGLIIAIPALGLYHFFKFRVSAIGNELDIQLERLVNAWLLKPSGDYVEAPPSTPGTERITAKVKAAQAAQAAQADAVSALEPASTPATAQG